MPFKLEAWDPVGSAPTDNKASSCRCGGDGTRRGAWLEMSFPPSRVTQHVRFQRLRFPMLHRRQLSVWLTSSPMVAEPQLSFRYAANSLH